MLLLLLLLLRVWCLVFGVWCLVFSLQAGFPDCSSSCACCKPAAALG
jgi:hypothetical protein